MGKKHKLKAAKTALATKVMEPQCLEGSNKRLKNTVRPYVQHILICTDSKSKQCKKGGPEVLKTFQKAIKERKLAKQVMVSEIGHVGGCSLGPNVLVYPEGVWYGQVEPDDVAEIINEHLLQGRVVERLLRGQRQDDPCGGCILTKPLVVAAQAAAEGLN
jgi:(2Fe-2S) ferredoxin